MPSIRLTLIVIRSHEPNRTVDFYELLGIRFQQEKHGGGPIHWAADLDGLVLEIYPVQVENESYSTPRLGFEVEDVASVLNSLQLSGVEVVNGLKKSQWGLRAVVRDPDGRTVELVQR